MKTLLNRLMYLQNEVYEDMEFDVRFTYKSNNTLTQGWF